jgi:hypothetical protein
LFDSAAMSSERTSPPTAAVGVAMPTFGAVGGGAGAGAGAGGVGGGGAGGGGAGGGGGGGPLPGTGGRAGCCGPLAAGMGGG